MMSNQSKLTYCYWRQPYARIVTLKYLTHCQKSQGAMAVSSGDLLGCLLMKWICAVPDKVICHSIFMNLNVNRHSVTAAIYRHMARITFK